MKRIFSDLWDKIPIVIKTYLLLFIVLLIVTVSIWAIDLFVEHSEDHHIFPIFANAFTVPFGAVIGALSQWVHHEFESKNK